MYVDDNFDRDYFKMLITMIATLFLSGLLMIAMLCSCTSVKYVPVESVKTDSIYINKVEVDSIYMQDSVYIKEKGDTIYMYKYKYLNRYKLLTDTMYVNRTDTIYNVVEVEKQLSKWQKVKLDLGGFAFGGIVVLAIIAIFALIKKRKW
jgi:hypothetical protein